MTCTCSNSRLKTDEKAIEKESAEQLRYAPCGEYVYVRLLR